jgi:hypothetical protein
VRITQECYRPLAPVLAAISFDVGATLCEFLEREALDVLHAIVRADRASVERLGHGNALAMPYHHLILPLASRRDKEVEVRWGVRDFARRFGRAPEGMWLPETAVDLETLDVLAAAGIAFTILAPHQVECVPLFGQPGVVRTRSGRRLTVFLYDGALSHDVAFGGLLADPTAWCRRLMLPPDDVRAPKLVGLATDGETYGHHHPMGIGTLGEVVARLVGDGIRVENYASFLARHPAREFVRVIENTSWSCAHGVERWRSDCGCRLVNGTSQAWRSPLRRALDELRGRVDALLAAQGRAIPDDPTVARHALPMDWHARRMFSSCGWFFDDIGGIEPRICLAHALRAIEYADGDAPQWLAALRQRLAEAASNDPEVGTGADVIDALLARRTSIDDG